MAGKVEIRTSGEKIRYVVLSRNGEILSRSTTFEDKASARRSLSSLTKALNGAEIIDVTRPSVLSPGQKSGLTKKRRARALKAAETRRNNAAA
jgi:uncharacterized protein YegP (UPF0339 family)